MTVPFTTRIGTPETTCEVPSIVAPSQCWFDAETHGPKRREATASEMSEVTPACCASAAMSASVGCEVPSARVWCSCSSA